MNVLSLFDGISCGQLALRRANIKVNNYFASEIDKHAITITQNNFPLTIQLGSVIDINSKNLLPIQSIDLLIGGSPCQGFSFAGKQLNFKDERSKLFFEFVRIKDELQPKYFLLENVIMKKEFSNIISEYMNCEPIEIDSRHFSAQNRKRLYWTNIPIREYSFDNNDEIAFNKVLYFRPRGKVKEHIKFVKKSNTLLAGNQFFRIIDHDDLYIELSQNEETKVNKIIWDSSQKNFCQVITTNNKIFNVIKRESFRKITPEEMEILQTLPIDYTNYVPKTHRHGSIGNGWTVDVLAHIFNGLKNE